VEATLEEINTLLPSVAFPPIVDVPVTVIVPTLEILQRFMLRFPVIAVLLVTVRAPRVAVPVTAALLETTRALVVSVPVV
jgi:hypothetical protein